MKKTLAKKVAKKVVSLAKKAKPEEVIVLAPEDFVPLVEAVEEVSQFYVSLVIGDKKYTAEGDELDKVLLSLNPESVKTKGVFVLRSNGMTAEIMKPAPDTKRITSNKINAIMFAKILAQRLK